MRAGRNGAGQLNAMSARFRMRCASAVNSARSTTPRAQLAGNPRMIPCEKLVYLPFQPTTEGLVCDGVSVHAIAAQVGTPVYIYSARSIGDAFRSIDEAF